MVCGFPVVCFDDGASSKFLHFILCLCGLLEEIRTGKALCYLGAYKELCQEIWKIRNGIIFANETWNPRNLVDEIKVLSERYFLGRLKVSYCLFY